MLRQLTETRVVRNDAPIILGCDRCRLRAGCRRARANVRGRSRHPARADGSDHSRAHRPYRTIAVPQPAARAASAAAAAGRGGGSRRRRCGATCRASGSSGGSISATDIFAAAGQSACRVVADFAAGRDPAAERRPRARRCFRSFSQSECAGRAATARHQHGGERATASCLRWRATDRSATRSVDARRPAG